MTDEWLDLTQAADLLGKRRDEVYLLVRRGELLAMRLASGQWRIQRSVVEGYHP